MSNWFHRVSHLRLRFLCWMALGIPSPAFIAQACGSKLQTGASLYMVGFIFASSQLLLNVQLHFYCLMTLRAYNPVGLYRAEGVGFFKSIQRCMVSFFFSFYGCAGSSLLHVNFRCSEWGYSVVVAVLRLLIVVTSLLVAHRLTLRLLGSRVVGHGQSCSTAERWNLCLLHWQVVSLPPNHRGGPSKCFVIRIQPW